LKGILFRERVLARMMQLRGFANGGSFLVRRATHGRDRMRRLICSVGLSLLAQQGMAQVDVPAAAASSAASAIASPPAQAPGMLGFVLGPSGTGAYYGWKIALVQSARNKGFVPQTSAALQSGQFAYYQLWPDRYLVRVFRLGDLQYQGWVDVRAQHLTRVFVDIGVFSSDVKVEPLREASALLREFGKNPGLAVPTGKTFRPYVVHDQGGIRVQYDGPQDAGEPRDGGTLHITQQAAAVATVEGALFSDNRIGGDLRFTDGRTLDPDGALGSDYRLAAGSRITWPDGTAFEGQYRGLQPAEGVLSLPDGRTWKGAVALRQPSGPGRMTHPDGSWIDVPRGELIARQSGSFQCGGVAVEPGACFYFAGQRVESAQEFDRLMAQQAAAAQMTAPPTTAASDGAPAQVARAGAASPSATGQDCQLATGVFHSDDGDTVWTLQGKGRGNGHFRQYTRGGATRYQFDVDLSYEATRDRITLRYGQGIYRERDSGRILQRTGIPGGSASCTFDGQRLVIDGKVFRRQ